MCLKALPYVKGDPGISFKWSRDGGSCNELRLEKARDGTVTVLVTTAVKLSTIESTSSSSVCTIA